MVFTQSSIYVRYLEGSESLGHKEEWWLTESYDCLMGTELQIYRIRRRMEADALYHERIQCH